MAGFTGFREGCPGVASATTEYSSRTVSFEDRTGEMLSTGDGMKSARAIRVQYADDNGANLFADQQLAFSEFAAARRVAVRDKHVREDGIRALNTEEIEFLGGLCGDCSQQTACPVLEYILKNGSDILPQEARA